MEKDLREWLSKNNMDHLIPKLEQEDVLSFDVLKALSDEQMSTELKNSRALLLTVGDQSRVGVQDWQRSAGEVAFCR